MRQRLKKNENENENENNLDEEEIFHKKDNIFFINIYHFGINFFNYLYKTIKFIIKISGLYIIWIILHYSASHLYIKLCVPNTVIGFLMSPFMTATPHCQGLRWLIYNAALMINNMWVLFGAWICSSLLFINNETQNVDKK